MSKPKKEPPYSLNELLDIVDGLKDANLGDMFISIVHALEDITKEMTRMDNEMRGYDP